MSVHDQMKLNYTEKIFEFYIYLNRRDIKLSYGEKNPVSIMITTKVMFDLLFHFSDILRNDLRRKWH